MQMKAADENEPEWEKDIKVDNQATSPDNPNFNIFRGAK
jgi:hypothetical protein